MSKSIETNGKCSARAGLLATTGLAALMLAIHPDAAFAATNITATGSTPVTVTSSGVTATGSDAIHTSAVDGNTLITINGGNVRSNTNGFAGINSSASGLGNLTVVINTGTVGRTGTSVTGPAVVLNQTGTGSSSITNSARMFGVGTQAYPVISIATTNAGSTTITNTLTGIINASDTTGNATGIGMAIRSTVATGADHIVNAGTLIGEISLSNQANSLDNSGTWNVQDNAGAGTIAAAFGSSGSNTLTNSGIIDAGYFTPGATATFTGVDAVVNSGTINVNGAVSFEGDATFDNTGGLIDMRAAGHATNDVMSLNIAVSGNTYTPGVAYNFIGGAGSEIGLDASLGGTPSSGADVPADRLLISGTATGSTGILLDNTSTTGAYNPQGITLVAVNGASSNAFYLEDVSGTGGGVLQSGRGPLGAVKTGFWFYPLLQTSHATALADGLTGANSSEYRLYGLPDVEVFQTPLAITGAEDIWYDTALGWTQRQDELRVRWPQVYGAADTYGDGKFVFWTKATGNWDRRTSTNSLDPYIPVPGQFAGFDTSFKQDTYSAQAGTDVGFNGAFGKDGVLVLGASIGLVNSALKFKTSINEFDYSGVTVGLSTDLLAGGWFWDTAFKADFLQTTLKYKTLTDFGINEQTVEADTWGVLSSTGYHINLGSHAGVDAPFLEPLLTLAYTQSNFGNLAATGAMAQFNDSDTFRGAAGARLGSGLFDTGRLIANVSVTGNYWDEFTNDTTATMLTSSGAPALTLGDQREKHYGEVSGQLNIDDKKTGWSGFLGGGAKFSSQFKSLELSGGIAFKW